MDPEYYKKIEFQKIMLRPIFSMYLHQNGIQIDKEKSCRFYWSFKERKDRNCLLQMAENFSKTVITENDSQDKGLFFMYLDETRNV